MKMDRSKFHFFWDGICSQWHPSEFAVDNRTFNSAEQYMMACKAQLFGDETKLKAIMESDSPKVQKAIGRTVENFDPKIWDTVSQLVVFKANIAKFTQNPDMRDFLLSTDDKIIVEASPYDKIWGVAMGEDDPDICDPQKWRGRNLLGVVCMEVREALRLARK